MNNCIIQALNTVIDWDLPEEALVDAIRAEIAHRHALTD